MKTSCGVHSHLNLGLCGRLLRKPGHMIDNGCKVGWSPELDGAQGSVVRLHHTRDAHTVWVLGVAIESKLMGHPGTNVATKAKSWKQFVSEGSRAAPITEVKNWEDGSSQLTYHSTDRQSQQPQGLQCTRWV